MAPPASLYAGNITVDVNSDAATAPKPRRTALFHDTSSQQLHPPYTFEPGCLAVSHEISHSNPSSLQTYLYLRTHRTLDCQGPMVSRHIFSTINPLAHITVDVNSGATAANSPRRKALFHDTSSQQLHPPYGCLAVSSKIIYPTLSPYGSGKCLRPLNTAHIYLLYLQYYFTPLN